MSWSNWTPEEYNTLRHERIEEAAALAHHVSFSDLAAWVRLKEIFADARQVRGFDGETEPMAAYDKD